MTLNYDTVKSTEKKEEIFLTIGGPKFRKVPDIGGPVTRKVIKNFTCSACGGVLDEAVTVNGKVRGWCGVTHKYVGGK